MKNSRRSSSFFGKFMLLVVLVGLGVISYGTYTYIQDSRKRADSATQATTQPTVAEEVDETTDTEETVTEQTITTLNTQVVDETKLNLVQTAAETTETVATPASTLTVRINFSRFNQDTNAFTLAATFANDTDRTLANCLLTISAGDQSVPQTVAVMQQQHMTGCRVNDLDLSSLSTPTTANPWVLTLNGQNEAGRTLISFERSITTFSNLINIK